MRATAWSRFGRNRLALLGLALVVVLGLSAALAPWLAPLDPTRQTLIEKRARPGGKYLLGADEFGRDILSRVIYGSRVALLVSVLSMLIALGGGLLLGTLAGYAGGWLDAVLMRGVEILLAFPYLLLALAIVAMLGPGVLNTTIAVGIWGVPAVTRIVRGSVLTLREAEYVGAARALGAPGRALLRRHILPNIIPGLIVYATLFMANAILLEAALSFLGLGVQPPTASWGLMVAAGRDHESPRRRRRLHAEPEEGQRRLQQDRVGHEERGVDDQPRDDVRQDVTAQERPAGRAQGAGRADVLRLAQRQHRAAHDARDGRHAPDTDGDRRVEHAGPEHGHDRQRQQQIREGEQDLDSAHEHGVDPAARETGERAQQQAAPERDEHREHAHQQRHARAVDHAGENVAPELVGAEQVFAAQPRAFFDQGLPGRIERRQPRRQRGAQREHDDERQAEQRQPVSAEAAPRGRPHRMRRRGACAGLIHSGSPRARRPAASHSGPTVGQRARVLIPGAPRADRAGRRRDRPGG